MKAFFAFVIAVFCYSGTTLAQDAQRIQKWYVPDFVVAQYAGSIGLISAGAGYDIFKGKAQVDVLVGYVPGFTGSEPLETVTFKFTVMPWEIMINPKMAVIPITAGTYFCYTPGREFSSNLPAWYPDGYYWWSEAVRVNLFIGGSTKFASDRLKAGSHVTAYYEIGTNEIKLVSYIQNRSALNIWTILHAGIGLRYHFAK